MSYRGYQYVCGCDDSARCAEHSKPQVKVKDMRDLVCRNALCSYMGIRMPSLSGASCALCGRFLVEPSVPVEPPTLSEQVKELEFANTNLKSEVATLRTQHNRANDLQERVQSLETSLKHVKADQTVWYDRFWLTCNTEFLALSGAPGVDDVFRALKVLRASSDDCAKMVEENNLLRKENNELKKTASQLQQKVKEQHDTIEYGAIGYYVGFSAKEWHDKYVLLRVSSDKFEVQRNELNIKLSDARVKYTTLISKIQGLV